MKLIKLKTKNFKKLGNASFEFTDGLNILVGDNATGKSTTLQAIEAALFGVTVIPGKKDNIPTWGQTTFSLELTFTMDTDVNNMTSHYVLTRTKTTAKLEEYCFDAVGPNPMLVANGNTPVTSYIENLLGLTAKDFNLFVLSRQGETSSILTFGAAALSRKVEEFAGIEMIDKVQGLANDRARTAQAEATANAVEPEAVAAAEKALSDANMVTDDAAAMAAACKLALDDLTVPTTNHPPVSSEELLRLSRAAAASVKRRDAAQIAYDSAVAALDELKSDPVADPGEAKDLEQQVKATRTELSAARARLKDIQAAVTESKRQQEELSKAEAALEAFGVDDDSEAVETLAGVRSTLAEHETDLAQVSLKLSQLKSLAKDAACPTCGTALTEHDPVKLQIEIDDLEEARVALTSEVRTAKSTIGDLEATISKVAQQRLEKDRLATTVQNLKASQVTWTIYDLTEEQDTVTAWEAKLEKESGELAVHEQKLTAFTSYSRRLNRATKAVTSALEDLEAVEVPETAPTAEEIDAAIAQEKEAERIQREYSQAKASAEAELKMAEAELRAAKQELARAQADVKRLKGSAAKSLEATKQGDQARRLSRFLGDRRAGYLTEVWDAVMAAATKQVRVSFNGDIEKLLYRDGEFLFVENGIEAPVSAASGAQRANIGAALRVGLARALYGNNSLLIFDEPTESSSETRAGDLVASLIGAAKQTLVITHRQQDQNLADNLILLGE